MASRVISFPPEAKLNRVLGILRILKMNEKKINVRELTRMSKGAIDVLLPQVTAARMLGLVTVREDDITLTELAIKMQESEPNAMRSVRNKLRKIEPFKSAYELSRARGRFTTEELVARMERNGVFIDSDSSKNVSLADQLLVQWAIFFNIVNYDGVKDVWIKEPGN